MLENRKVKALKLLFEGAFYWGGRFIILNVPQLKHIRSIKALGFGR